jgi:hypothetical protein
MPSQTQKVVPAVSNECQAELAALLLDPDWGLVRAAATPSLHEFCLALGEHYAAVARGTGSSKGLIHLLPLLLQEAVEDLRRRRAPRREERVLLAARLAWMAPQLAARGQRLAHRAWARVWAGWPQRPERPIPLL